MSYSPCYGCIRMDECVTACKEYQVWEEEEEIYFSSNDICDFYKHDCCNCPYYSIDDGCTN